MEEEGGGGEAAEGGRELGQDSELEAELGLTGATFAGDLGDGAARESAGKVAVDDRRARGELWSQPGPDLQGCRPHRFRGTC